MIGVGARHRRKLVEVHRDRAQILGLLQCALGQLPTCSCDFVAGVAYFRRGSADLRNRPVQPFDRRVEARLQCFGLGRELFLDTVQQVAALERAQPLRDRVEHDAVLRGVAGDLLLHELLFVYERERATGTDGLTIVGVLAAAGCAEPAVLSVLHLQPVRHIVARRAGLVGQVLAEGGKRGWDVVRMQLVGPALADVRELAFVTVPDQPAELRRPEPLAAGIERVGVVQHRSPEPNAAGIVEHIRPLLHLTQFRLETLDF